MAAFICTVSILGALFLVALFNSIYFTHTANQIYQGKHLAYNNYKYSTATEFKTKQNPTTKQEQQKSNNTHKISLILCDNIQKSCHTQLSSNLILNDLASNASWRSTYKSTKTDYK